MRRAACCPKRTTPSSTRFLPRTPDSPNAASRRWSPTPISCSPPARGCDCGPTCTAATVFSPRCWSASHRGRSCNFADRCANNCSCDPDTIAHPMIAPIDFSRLQVALALPRGWLELVLTLACIGIAWLVDRRIAQRRARRLPQAHLPGSFIDLGFPLIALLLVYVASIAWRHAVGPPFFLAIATPILIALAVIRMLAYALHRLFPAQTWLPASEVAIGTAIWGLAILYFLGVLPEIRSTLAELVIPIGKSQVSLLTIFTGIAVVVVTLVVTLWISGLIEQRLALATQLDANLRVVLAKFIRAVLILVGVLIALEQIGFDLTLLTVFGGALGVGIGLGLQKLASNYIAGFTILLDRSIRLGDMVTVDNRTGVVSVVTSRYVVVRGLDSLEAIVPNEMLVTTTVLNHSYTSKDVKLGVLVQISYDSDLDKALA